MKYDSHRNLSGIFDFYKIKYSHEFSKCFRGKVEEPGWKKKTLKHSRPGNLKQSITSEQLRMGTSAINIYGTIKRSILSFWFSTGWDFMTQKIV